jgi:hypothetical protein
MDDISLRNHVDSLRFRGDIARPKLFIKWLILFEKCATANSSRQQPPILLVRFQHPSCSLCTMGSKAEFIEVDNRIRSLTTILNNFNHRVSPSSDPNGHPSLLQHFANLLSTGHKNSPDAGKVVAVTGLLLPDGKT